MCAAPYFAFLISARLFSICNISKTPKSVQTHLNNCIQWWIIIIFQNIVHFESFLATFTKIMHVRVARGYQGANKRSLCIHNYYKSIYLKYISHQQGFWDIINKFYITWGSYHRMYRQISAVARIFGQFLVSFLDF